MESGWNVWVWLVGVVSRRQVWLVGVGGIYGCVRLVGVVVRRYIYIDFLILLIPTPLVSALFCSSILLFVHKKKCFSFLFRYFSVIYVLIFYRSINTHMGDYGHPTEAI